MPAFDFHIHSGLSACAEKTMSPRQILGQAKKAGLDFIAITDHNSSANVRPTIEASRDFEGVTVIPGIEVSSIEEAHFLALFEDCSSLADFQELIDGSMPEEENPSDIFGYQIIYDQADEIVDTDDRLRQIGTGLSIDKLVHEVKSRNGFIVPSHVFREKFSLKSQLGFIMPGAGFDAMEISARQWVNDKFKIGMRIEGYPLITGSDSHFIEFVGRIFNRVGGNASNLKELFKIISEFPPG